jgi:flagellar motor switch protein FliG
MMESVLVKAFGENKGHDVTRRANGDILAKRPFAVFEALTPPDLANLLTEEHPQISAVFLAHLDRKKGGEVLRFLDEEMRADLVRRVATLDRTPPDVVQRVLDVMRRKVKDLGLTTLRSEPKAWIKAAAQLLNNMGGGEKVILEKIESGDADMAMAIRNEMFTFDDLAKLDKKSMQKILASVDSRILAVSLKAAIPPVEVAILGNLSKRAADMVKEEKDSLGPTPLSEVVAAQQEILKLIRDLMDKGEVKVGGADEMV